MMTTMELTPDEAKAIRERRARETASALASRGIGIQGRVLKRLAHFTVTRYSGGHHPQYAVYNGQEMICLCVYRKGAFALLDFIKAAMQFLEKTND